MSGRQPSVWDCRDCCDQMFTGRRCATDNPTPEEREQRESSNVTKCGRTSDVVEQPDEEFAF